MSEEVHLEVTSPLVDREHLDRSVYRDTGVVDQRSERPSASVVLHALRDRRHVCRVGDVEDDRLDALAGEPLGVRLVAHPRQDLEPARSQGANRRLPDARRRSGNDCKLILLGHETSN